MHSILQKIKTQGLLPLYFHPDPAVCEAVMRALYEAGIRVVEFTNRGEQALENFAHLRHIRDREWKDLTLGIGTIKTGEQARHYIAEGADFLISPGFVPEVGAVAAQHNQFWVPGCMTPTEIIAAENMGATFVKLFPGNLLGPAFVSAVRELFPGLAFMPTGGAEPERANLEAWFKAGVAGVGMGSRLISAAVLQEKAYAKITEQTRMVLELIREIRAAR
ncbi:bifunctional 4-hydroxy-2-oxoglutarate aldolase/2-dehydro-3-deoxy-phosphogluconate aldolase [Dinghuibacter silviterrae]|uniref:2-dehydro-3-deoxyphosphogluconate aldolase/(4S)-4-hydroxy-2-oxoglutarate aldolase n=1 Tax=Dinghuibacter silviterrae TaxID=1539049 RepID=A0A4R8DNC3_9BACT|nr:bifunctional 4-hydroxy-2-oxoglutarate aldolase/2-dehydro-3-deoxy-phosphogluconate aldolase [Dinghuibacter silviterrae]TDW99197.1 2-dehydro-3-deoxyphosphogluconate aldolase/(4S)-4-hydroxy-2-oxoglutarate aldolase [Dinghuibacter silviterrae]